ncbi:hypothetical protein B0H65DRAFT_511864 [Neurospora tetraspora]|uniref:Uncharacterized protein n=1 Tax=Neurospora tetraspora TaxID=94610 RepID=A0AAE0J6R0_9PEZI|nr:hypothetical protein B0H65DRAFT_511864 [Neurospora tetraspora]
MALSNGCAHHFVLIKSESSLIQWTCQLCHSGPHYFIYECRYCKMRTRALRVTLGLWLVIPLQVPVWHYGRS